MFQVFWSLCFFDEQVQILANFHWTFSFQQAFNCCNRFEFNQIHEQITQFDSVNWINQVT